jgi:hypothetical protein
VKLRIENGCDIKGVQCFFDPNSLGFKVWLTAKKFNATAPFQTVQQIMFTVSADKSQVLTIGH